MPRERYIEIEGARYFKEDINKMDYEQIKMLVSFCSSEATLSFIQNSTENELAQVYIDNLIFSLK